MANGRDGKRSKKNAVSIQGAWFPMPLEFLRSRAFASLSPHAAKMLLDLCSQLNRNASNNGMLSAAPEVMELRGWTSTGSRQAAVEQLLQAGVLSITRPGNRRLCTLYAVTLWPLDYDPAVMVHGPGAYATSDWEKGTPNGTDQLTPNSLRDHDPPTPVVWRVLRKDEPRKTLSKASENENSYPVAGQPPANMTPPRESPTGTATRSVPATGSLAPFSPVEVTPQRDTSLEKPSSALSSAEVGEATDGHDEESAAVFASMCRSTL